PRRDALLQTRRHDRGRGGAWRRDDREARGIVRGEQHARAAARAGASPHGGGGALGAAGSTLGACRTPGRTASRGRRPTSTTGHSAKKQNPAVSGGVCKRRLSPVL